jgi:hypothetical protein
MKKLPASIFIYLSPVSLTPVTNVYFLIYLWIFVKIQKGLQTGFSGVWGKVTCEKPEAENLVWDSLFKYTNFPLPSPIGEFGGQKCEDDYFFQLNFLRCLNICICIFPFELCHIKFVNIFIVLLLCLQYLLLKGHTWFAALLIYCYCNENCFT